METLLIILQNRNLRLTNATCLNDSKELTWVLHKLEEDFNISEQNQISNFLLTNDPVNNFKKQIRDIFSMLLGNEEEREKNAPFTISFSHSGDILSQWRAYGNDGMGVSIGFNRFKLSKLFENVSDINILEGDCNYLKNSFFDKDNVSTFSDIVKKGDSEKQMLCFFSFYKNPAFEEEKEYRIIVPKSDNLDISYRIGRNDKIIPYIEPILVDKAHHLPIVEIKLGPKNVNSDQMVSSLLNSYSEKYGAVKITRSTATYR